MTDLVKQLRWVGDHASFEPHMHHTAADRIEKLEAALRVYAEEDHWSGDTFEPIMFPEGECKCCYEHFSDRGEIARKALEGKVPLEWPENYGQGSEPWLNKE